MKESPFRDIDLSQDSEKILQELIDRIENKGVT